MLTSLWTDLQIWSSVNPRSIAFILSVFGASMFILFYYSVPVMMEHQISTKLWPYSMTYFKLGRWYTFLFYSCNLKMHFLSNVKHEIFHTNGHVSYNLSDNSCCFELLQPSIMWQADYLHPYFPALHHCVWDGSKQESVRFYFDLMYKRFAIE